MPLYEFVCLAKPALPRASLAKMMARTGEIVMDDGGIITKILSYGEQSLAYDIRKPFVKFDKVIKSAILANLARVVWYLIYTLYIPTQAHIWQLNFVSNPETLLKVQNELKLNEEALRWLILKRNVKGSELDVTSTSR
jgi:small subunit ribosomal protein S6